MKPRPLLHSTYSRQPRQSAIAILGALASLLLHVLLLAPVLFGAATQKNRLPTRDTGASATLSDDSSMTLVFVEESDSGAAQSRQTDYVDLVLPAPNTLLAPIAVPDVSLAPLVSPSDSQGDDEATGEVDTSDPGHALLLGRYVGQIDARIQRAWIKPRTPIVASGLFACRVRIVQDHGGLVQEIELVSCNGDASWQMSLVHAIQSASPLPAPPDPRVFSTHLTLKFTSQPFAPDANPEGFEPEQCTAME
jgi:TonB C terminal